MCKSVVCQIPLACTPKSAKYKKWYLCVCTYVCVCGVPNIKLVKCKNGICLCVHVSVCGMPLINLLSLACLLMSQKVQNVQFFKNS